jgi:hypothetical protein
VTESLPQDGDGERRTFYVAAPGTGTISGVLRQVAVFGAVVTVGCGVAAVVPADAPAHMHDVAILWALGAMLFTAWYVLARMRVTVGPDGVELLHHKKRRFFPIEAILGTSVRPYQVVLFLEEAKTGEREVSLVSRERVQSSISGASDPDMAHLGGTVQSYIDAYVASGAGDATRT